ncbi:MAG: carbamoyltransferase HypF [Planctomycetota bacterium]
MIRRRLLITGLVQGVGFRPFLWRRATRLGLAGGVENTPAGVVVDVQGPAAAVAAFQDGLATAAPPLAVIDVITVTQVPPAADVAGPFRILATAGGDRPHTLVPADVATCAACLRELRDPADPRHGHAFITCTDCGPRFTIIERMPYDRAATTMRMFAMCPRCAADYADPADRRFHAEPIACPDCGPVAWFTTTPPAQTGDVSAAGRPATRINSAATLAAAQSLLAAGGILAVKSLGGFHLACDATNARAVALLRERKRRPTKPLAVMVADLDAARRIAVVDEQAARLLTGPERPIVLVPKHPDGGGPAAAIAPANGFLGVMLPTAPLQHLLAAGLPPLVMTSGNLAEEPIATDNGDAVRRLAGIADGFLLHDRDILVPCDDPVVRCVAGAALPIRRSRGHAPLPIRLAAGGPTVLAVGGELKAALCLAVGDRAIMGQHIGDMGNLETLAAIQRAAEHLLGLFAAEPAAVVADLHPGYLSADWAARFAAACGIPLLRVQHHEAHTASLLAEHMGAAAPPPGSNCLVACFDGTGYSADGTIRGGEFFHVTASGIERVAHLAPFALPGGDASIRHPWRAALAVLHAAGIPWDESLPPVRAATEAERRVLARQFEGGFTCPPTTSMGRLFDAVAALVGLASSVSYEAEAALELESLAATAGAARQRYAFSVSAAAIDWRPVVAAIVADVQAGVPAAAIAAGFHDAVAGLIHTVAERFGDPDQPVAVGLTGGVFQNAVLTEATLAAARSAGRELLVHHEVPPNDGGLALGQALLGRDRLAATGVSLP